MAVVVLGQRLESDQLHPELRGRMDVGLAVFRTTEASALILTGGHTNDEVARAEADAMAEYARENGVADSAIYTETRAKDTIGNAYFTRQIVDAMDDVDRVHVVTSCYHTARAKLAFEQCFGDDHRVIADSCYDAGQGAGRAEAARARQTREFFDPVPVGDIAAIRTRLVEVHDEYDSLPPE